jgi:hypothetical protein
MIKFVGRFWHMTQAACWANRLIPKSPLEIIVRSPAPRYHGDDLGLLLARSALGLLAGAFLVRPHFFAGSAFLPALRPLLRFAVGAGLRMSLLSIAFSLIGFLLDRVAVVTSHHSGSKKSQAESLAIK